MFSICIACSSGLELLHPRDNVRWIEENGVRPFLDRYIFYNINYFILQRTQNVEGPITALGSQDLLGVACSVRDDYPPTRSLFPEKIILTSRRSLFLPFDVINECETGLTVNFPLIDLASHISGVHR